MLEPDLGQVGLVIDTRAIFKKGYAPTHVEVDLADHAGRSATVDVDSFTNLAFFVLANEELSAAEQAAFADGVAMTLRVVDEADVELELFEDDSVVLDDSNFPLSLDTTLPYIQRPLEVEEGVPYLLQIEGKPGVVTSTCSDCYAPSDFTGDATEQQFMLTAVADKVDTFLVQHVGYAEGTYWYPPSGNTFINLNGGANPLPAGGPTEFVFEQDDDGWFRIRIEGTADYLTQTGIELHYGTTMPPDRFRLISDDIAWVLTDRGTVFNQPILQPTRVDFAYEARLENCSAATLTETVGKSDSRTRTTTMETSESLQLFSSDQLTVGVVIGVEAGVKVQGAGEVKASEQISVSESYTTSSTTTSANTWSESTEETSEVSRVRELQVPPRTAVEVFDEVHTVENVRIPFIQTLRIAGTYKSSSAPLSGPELVTQMQFNFVGGVVTEVGADFIDVTIRGRAIMDQVFNASTRVNELPDACD